MGIRGACIAGSVAAAFLLAPPVSLGAPPATGDCAAAGASLALGQVDKARNQYLSALAADPGSPCAAAGLARVTRAARREARLCAEGSQLADAGKTEAAEARYAMALAVNVDSACAKKGLTPPEEGEGFWDWVGDAIDLMPKISSALAAFFGVVLALFAVLALLGAAWARRRRASLVVKPFADDAIETRVGAGVAGLLEHQLIELRRREPVHDGYDLDFVVADVELLASEEKLSGSVGSLAEVPQLQLVVALLDLLDRFIPTRRLAVGGELLPAGRAGPGLALALYKRNGVRARNALWHDQVEDLSGEPAALFPAPSGGANARAPPDVSPYYDLATPASWWVQYEAARALDARVGLTTTSARSFALLGTGIASQRKGELLSAAEAYARALRIDPDNVAALVNLALALARLVASYRGALILLTWARRALEIRYEEAS